MVPAEFIAHGALPLTPSGKVHRRLLAAQGRGQNAAGSRGTPPRTDLEQLVADAFHAVLGIAAVAVEDDFFALGGHSLSAMRLAARLSSAVAHQVGVGAVFEAPTVAELADVWPEAVPARWRPSPGRGRGTIIPSRTPSAGCGSCRSSRAPRASITCPRR